MVKLALIVPVYNEEKCLKTTNKTLLDYLDFLISKNKITKNSFILYIDDGSKDNSLTLIKEFHNLDKRVLCLSLAHNKGHQNALLCGLNSVIDHCDVSISIDADLQDDVNAIEEMIDKYNNGKDIVLGVRNKREKDKFIKRFTANLFYSFMNFLGANTVKNHADYRLMSNRVLKDLTKYKEVNLFLRGVILDIGYDVDYVYYERLKRQEGKTKYSVSKMFNLALAGITSFSLKPLRLIIFLGIFIFLIGSCLGIYSIIGYYLDIFYFNYMFIILIILASLIIISVGVVGEYVGRTYMEVKSRPKYIIKEKIISEDIINENNVY